MTTNDDVGMEVELTDDDPRSLLIELIKNYPLLYDLSHSDYKFQSRKDQAWAEIASVIGISSEDCQKLWKSVRDRYTRERRVKNPENAPSRWCFYDKMSFYAKFTKPRKFKFKICRTDATTDKKLTAFSQQDSSDANSSDNSKIIPPNTKILIRKIKLTENNKSDSPQEPKIMKIETITETNNTNNMEESQNNFAGSNRAFVEYLHCLLEELPPEEAKEKRKQILLWMLT
ncbi:unnamed protein product [Ceutorhynchus assimilis]|uniref:MADF domain-containing protein n=1 Tax=Ceutorhynchus assimilis TaxID=467358 RepID=A0A9N9MLF4_9CUCU|nr:unnamed protein product [Ceutorhynchus assimilis]